MDPAQMTGAAPPQGGMPPPPQQPTSTGQPMVEPGGQSQVGMDLPKIMEVLGIAVQQCVDQQGYVDLNKLVQLWPQLAQQGGVNVPFQTVMELIQKNPSMIEDLIIRHGLAGIIANGQRIPAEQLAGMGNGAVPQQPVQGGA